MPNFGDSSWLLFSLGPLLTPARGSDAQRTCFKATHQTANKQPDLQDATDEILALGSSSTGQLFSGGNEGVIRHLRLRQPKMVADWLQRSTVPLKDIMSVWDAQFWKKVTQIWGLGCRKIIISRFNLQPAGSKL